MFGQSYQLFGVNSFAVGDNANTGIGSGLDTGTLRLRGARSPISRTASIPFTSRFRFDQDNFEVRRFETEARANFDRWSVSAALRQLRRPAATRLPRRGARAFSAAPRSSSTQNWQATAAVRYDIDAHSSAGTAFGVGYIDDCFIIALNYITNYTYSGNVDEPISGSCCR